MTSLRNLLEPAEAPFAVELRSEPAQLTVAIGATIERHEIAVLVDGRVRGDLRDPARRTRQNRPDRVAACTQPSCSPTIGVTPRSSFPYTKRRRTQGRVHRFTVPAAELAVVTHAGTDEDIDLAYGAPVGRYVSERALGVDGPVREYYTVAAIDTPDVTRWRTEIAWPIFRTAAS